MFHLQEIVIRAALHLDQIGHLRHFGDAPETFADFFAAGEALAPVDVDRCVTSSEKETAPRDDTVPTPVR
jgi:hypothetical protein